MDWIRAKFKSNRPNGADADHEGSFANPLPGGDDVLGNTILGHYSEWSLSLRVAVKAIGTLPYPAAVYWTGNLVLLHNQAWADVGGTPEQGKAQRPSLSSETSQSLLASFHGTLPSKIDCKDLLRATEDHHTNFMVLVSPLFENDQDSAKGVLVQLLPKPNSDLADSSSSLNGKRDKSNEKKPSKPSRTSISNDPTEATDDVPLNQHPFFARFSAMLPVGLAILDHKAEAVFVNDNFHQLTTHRGEDQSFRSWPQSIHTEDYQRVLDAYKHAFDSAKRLRIEFRAQSGQWRLLLLTPLGDENLRHISLRSYGGFICSIVDINSEKSAELTERKSAKEAKERKEQQEKFMDMISHEIRNPLSAIIHCSEDIAEAVRCEKKTDIDVHAITEAVDTINLCVTHQQNIVDDVLNFSKLDASLLSLTPYDVQPGRHLAGSLKMFLPEFRKQKITFDYQIDQSYVDADVAWVKADLRRINQVLVNLLTNAIKFTAKKPGEKKVSVSVGASIERPRSYPPNVVYFDSQDNEHVDATEGTEWGTGKALFVMAAIKDTGIGISDEGQKRLFERFRQATPKTEEIYGGSGLGLNISRKICGIHGGEIGVSSKEGKGSTFGFFFRVKRVDTPAEEAGTAEAEAEEDELRKMIRAQGNRAPSQDETVEVPQSLKTPPVVQNGATSPFGSKFDNDNTRWEHTASIAWDITEKNMDSFERVGKTRPPENTQVPNGATEKRQPDDTVEGGDQLPPIHCLLVEDNIVNQRLVFRKLQSRGYSISIANNGQAAVEAVKNAPRRSSGDTGAFDVILMDQEMPVLDGNGATRAIRELEKKGEVEFVPILGVTANVRGAQQDEMFDAGMNDIIHKPYKIDEMVAKIGKLVASERRDSKQGSGKHSPGQKSDD